MDDSVLSCECKGIDGSMKRLVWIGILILWIPLGIIWSESPYIRRVRRMMVERIEEYYPFRHGVVRQALEQVPRHEFIPLEQQPHAYQIIPLPIGYGQTISAPDIVAIMTDELNLDSQSRVLEIGTGSGYQAAVLGEITPNVFSIEVIPQLAAESRERLDRLGYDYIRTRMADGYYGWPEEAPFQAIIVTAATDHVPPPLLQQLAPGGIMVIPVGPPGGIQSLMRITKDQDGRVHRENLLSVRFVPFVHGN